MTKEDKYFDELLRDKVGGYEVKPPAYLWERIEEVQQQRQRKKLFLYIKIGGIAAAVLLAFVFGWQINNQLGTSKLQPVTVQTQEKADVGDERAEDESSMEMPFVQKQELSVQKEEVTSRQEIGVAKSNQDNRLVAVVSKDVTDSHKIGNYALINAIRLPEFSIRRNDDIKQIRYKKVNEPQTLTIEDLETIKRNEQLLAMNEAKQKGEGDLWQIAAMVTPNYSVNQTSHQSSYASNMSVPGARENVNMGGGLAVEYKAGKRWSIQSGVYYSQLEQASSNQTSDRSAQSLYDGGNTSSFLNNAVVEVKSDQMLLNATAGVVEINDLPSGTRIGNTLVESKAPNNAVLLTAAEFQQNFEYVEVPLNVRYKLVDSGFDVSLLGGFSTNFLVGNDAYLRNDQGRERIGETRNMNKLNYSTTFGLGFGYGITDRISMRLEPQVKYYLGSLNNSSSVTFKPYTIGVYTGLSYRF